MKKVVVAAAIRNIEHVIKPVFDNINTLTSIFDEVECVLVESDSYDRTIEALKHYKDYLNCRLDVYSFGYLQDKIPNRMQRICKARNFYLDIVQEKYSNYDYLLVIDFNETNIEPYDLDSFKTNFEISLEWDMICANQEQTYYDLYALRHETWMPFNCWNAIGNRPSFMSYETAHNMYVKSRFLNIKKTHPPIKVMSAFGGSAFIKISSIGQARHRAVDDSDEEECEWVSFCKALQNVYINPMFINMRRQSRHAMIANTK
ncbi:Mannosyltransferase 1, CMT1 [uncultured Caudovirales phage]|uniref:Mannosyltransferase 1, CMT1 n=1 Tax=uncultured Caudovirales phage TaxID=2100421 RepID=A0A6J7X728_9CAUD|nr:Mannosyltransferase 1, CMT1 [uncultured Caudovirales phage]